MRILSLLFVLLFSLPTHSQQHLQVGYVEFAPYYYTDDKGEVHGYLVNLAQTLADHSGFTIEFRSYPVKRLVKYITSGEVDVFLGMPTLKAFSENALISSMPIDTIQLRAYSLRELPPVQKKEDLVGKNILVLRGYSYGGWIQFIRDPANKVNYRIADSHKQALKMLVRREVDYLLDYKLPVAHAQKGMTLPTFYYNDVVSFQPRIMVSRKLHNAEEVMHKFEQAFRELFPNGAEEVKKSFQITLPE